MDKKEYNGAATTIFAGEAFMNGTGDHLIAFAIGELDTLGFELRIANQKGEYIHKRPFDCKGSMVESLWVVANNVSQRLLIYVNHAKGAGVISVSSNAPYETLGYIELAAKGARQIRTNDWWMGILCTQGRLMNMWFVDIEKGIPVCQSFATNNKSAHLAVVGTSKRNTVCYIVERHASAYHVARFQLLSNVVESPPLTWILPTLDGRNKSIIFMDSHKNRVVVVAQDNKKRPGMADLTIFVLETSLQSRDLRGKIFNIEGYKAPVKINMQMGGLLIVAHENECGAINVGSCELSNEREMARNISNGFPIVFLPRAKRVLKFTALEWPTGEPTPVAWFCDPEAGFLVASIFDPEKAAPREVMTDLCFEPTETRQNAPKLYPVEDHIFTVQESDGSPELMHFAMGTQ
jgi:hypothetical protein